MRQFQRVVAKRRRSAFDTNDLQRFSFEGRRVRIDFVHGMVDDDHPFINTVARRIIHSSSLEVRITREDDGWSRFHRQGTFGAAR